MLWDIAIEKNLLFFPTFIKKCEFCNIMWFEQVSTLDLILKGLIIGIVSSAPMGPVGVLCIQRILNNSRTNVHLLSHF